jgi:hypothetical protein
VHLKQGDKDKEEVGKKKKKKFLDLLFSPSRLLITVLFKVNPKGG